MVFVTEKTLVSLSVTTKLREPSDRNWTGVCVLGSIPVLSILF